MFLKWRFLCRIEKSSIFDGINWEDVADYQSHLPYEPSKVQIKLDKPIDLAAMLKDGINEVLDESLLDKFRSKFKINWLTEWMNHYNDCIHNLFIRL